MISGLTITAIIFSIIFSIVFPVGMCIFLHKKYKTSISVFFIGCATWFVFAVILETLVHNIVLSSNIGSVITNNIFLYGCYGGLAAAVFEETGRWVAMKFLMKKQYGNPYNSIMYGAGHGGIEVLLVLGAANLNNLIYSVMINMGQMDILLNPLPDEQKEILNSAITTLTSTKPYMFLMGDVERISAVILHISLSVFVWIAVVNGKKYLFALALFGHFLMDASTVIINSYLDSVIALEIIVLVIALIFAGLAVYYWKKYIKAEGLDESKQNE